MNFMFNNILRLSSRPGSSDHGPPADVVIIVMGPTGSGKSTFINKALGENKLHVGHGLESCTQDVYSVRCRYPEDESRERHRTVLFVETPAFTNETKSQRESERKLMRWLEKIPLAERKNVLGILYLTRISDPRMAVSPMVHLDMFEKLCGSSFPPQVLFITTMWGRVPAAKAELREEELRTKHWRPMINLGSRVMRFGDTSKSAWEAVDLLLDTSQAIPKDPSGINQSSTGLLARKWPTLTGLLKSAGRIQSPVGGIRTILKPQEIPDDVVVAVMGPTGVGKSSFINVATGKEDARVNHGLEPCTKDIAVYRMHCPVKSSRDVIFIDTPGLDEEEQPDHFIFKSIGHWLKEAYKGRVKLAGVLYLHRISDNRVSFDWLSETPIKISAFEDVCEKDVIPTSVLATTMWDEVDDAVGEAREQQLKGKYWKEMVNRGSRVLRYDNTRPSAWALLQDIIMHAEEKFTTEVGSEVEVLHDKLRTKERGELGDSVGRSVRRMQEAIQQLRAKQCADAVTLRDEYEELRVELQATIDDIHKLEVPVGRCLLHMARTVV